MKKKIVLGIIAAVLIVLCGVYVGYCSKVNAAEQEELKAQQQELWGEIVNDAQIPEEWYLADGFDNIQEWWEEIKSVKTEYATYISDTVAEYDGYLTEEQLAALQEMSDQMAASHSILEIHGILNSVDQVRAEAQAAKDAAAQQATTSIASYSGGGGYSSDFKSAGVVYQNGWRYTWYSQNTLPGGGLNIPGRHVEDGFVKDGNGNIVVASSSDSYGDIVDTPYGQGKVYDSGCAAGTRDLYTDY